MHWGSWFAFNYLCLHLHSHKAQRFALSFGKFCVISCNLFHVFAPNVFFELLAHCLRIFRKYLSSAVSVLLTTSLLILNNLGNPSLAIGRHWDQNLVVQWPEVQVNCHSQMIIQSSTLHTRECRFCYWGKWDSHRLRKMEYYLFLRLSLPFTTPLDRQLWFGKRSICGY